jgi:hypothetical protein
MKAAFVVVLLGLLPAPVAAAWLEVSAHERVNPAAVVAIEIRADGSAKEASIRTASGAHIVRAPNVIQELETMAANTAMWFPARGETIGQKSIKRYVRKGDVLFVKYSCASMSACTAFVDGYDGSFSRIVIDAAGAVAELKQATGKEAEFTLVESPAAGFEAFVRRTAIRSMSFICSSATACTQADVTVPGGTRITRDAAGIKALRDIAK